MSLSVFSWWTVLAKMLPADTFEVWSGWGHGGEIETSTRLELFPDLMDMKEARGIVPEVDPFVNEIWTFDEITAGPGSRGPGSRGPGSRRAGVASCFLLSSNETTVQSTTLCIRLI